jgi:hypothetical protein
MANISLVLALAATVLVALSYPRAFLVARSRQAWKAPLKS